MELPGVIKYYEDKALLEKRTGFSVNQEKGWGSDGFSKGSKWDEDKGGL
jgi:hypothetical protein